MAAPRSNRALALLASLAVGQALAGCATFEHDVHLSPLYSNLSSAGGGREVEAFAGIVRIRRPTPHADVNEWAVRPLLSHHVVNREETLTRFLVPLGKRTTAPDETLLQLLPVARFHQDVDEHGHPEWRLLMLPGILWSREPHGRIVRAFFPFGGVIERFLTYEKVVFALFPLYAQTERHGRKSYHFLWPVFGYATQPGVKPSWRLWPLFGISRTKDYDRRFFLWPIFQWHHDDLRDPPGQQMTKTMVFPLWGHARKGGFHATSLLWPFFGYSYNTDTGFWAFDGPWPLVRIRRPGHSGDDITRTRFWPFWSHYRGEGLDSTWVLWPLMNQRHETYRDGERHGEFLVPLWQSWGRFDTAGRPLASWTKLWPFYQRYEEGDTSRTALPALNPLWHTPVIDDHYAWIYELYTREQDGDRVRERSWGGIWRRDVDSREERQYLSGLWSQRKYEWQGEEVRETSLLLGLLRWRSRPGAPFRLLLPAFPGPGWPIERRAAPETP